MNEAIHRIVIIGGGFAGLQAARSLRDIPVRITLIDKRNYHLFQPMILQVATGILCPSEITTPLRYVFRKQENLEVILGEVVDFDPGSKRVILGDGEVEYDTLIVAAGSKTNYFGHDEWARFAPSLKTVDDAAMVCRKIFYAFEVVERENDQSKRREWLTFIIVGGGFTGIALSGMIADIVEKTVVREFRNIRAEEVKVILLEAADRILPHSTESLSRKTSRILQDSGVTISAGSKVTGVDENGITAESKGKNERIPAKTVIWAAGVNGVDLGRKLAEKTGAQHDHHGRVMVNSDLGVPGYRDIFVIGDLAHFSADKGEPLPLLAAVAGQQGRYTGNLIRDRLLGKETGEPFRYRDRGISSVIGRKSGIVNYGRFLFDGFPAWLIWLFAHLSRLIQFQNRLIVMTRWLFLSFGYNLGSRQLTVGDSHRLPLSSP